MSKPVYRILAATSYQKDGEERTKYTQLGVVWALNREGFRLQFEFLPANFSEHSLLLLPYTDDKNDSSNSSS